MPSSTFVVIPAKAGIHLSCGALSGGDAGVQIRQSGLAASINAIFQSRRHSFSCFSRVIAASALSSISK